jgi:hypothetical protein
MTIQATKAAVPITAETLHRWTHFSVSILICSGEGWSAAADSSGKTTKIVLALCCWMISALQNQQNKL